MPLDPSDLGKFGKTGGDGQGERSTPVRDLGAAPRVIGHASEMTPDQRYCTCCERPLIGKMAWLELDQRTNLYHDFGDVPAELSQGWFPFGMTCARKLIAKARP